MEQELNKQGKYDIVVDLRVNKLNPQLKQGFKAQKIEEEFLLAEKMLQHSKAYSFYEGRKPRRLGVKIPLLILFGFYVVDYLQEKRDQAEEFLSNPEEHINKFVKKIKRKIRNRDFNPYSRQLNDIVYEVVNPEDIKENLSDVKGIEECLVQVRQIINFLKNPDLFIQKGAKIPKGVLLHGDPGVGKTMIARAIAKEANVNFIYQNGSTFDELFVGQGSRRVRLLFEKAKEIKPCIIFIDEIDSLLAKSKRSYEDSSSRSTVNNFLSEMDGFEKNEKIIVFGATNFIETMDEAAIRPGRFDSKLYIPKPDQKGRIEIFKHYLDKISYHPEINPELLAKSTPNLTPAQISNLVNTAICDAVHDSRYIAKVEDLNQARDKILMGLMRKTLTMTEKQRLSIAIHEMGHTLTNLYTQGSMDLEKVTIIPRGRALGVTLQQMSEEKVRSLDKESMMAIIDIAMGGHIAEKIFIGEGKIASGCSSDLQKATQIARQAVRKFGMFKGYGVGLIASQNDEVSEKYNAEIDECVRRILQESSDRVYNLLLSRHEEFRLLSKELYLHDTLTSKQIDQLRAGKKLKEKTERSWTKELEQFYREMKKQLKKKGGKRGSPPIIEIVRRPHSYEEKDTEWHDEVPPSRDPSEEQKERKPETSMQPIPEQQGERKLGQEAKPAKEQQDESIIDRHKPKVE